ncbi:MAG: hypothetical protein M0009_14215 [Deltaproteobacteria bacterium]|nr:hypothetical protein [Deltaproteobacteria bacterium]
MNQRIATLTFSLVALFMVCLWANTAAAGLIDHETHITNTTSFPAEVTLTHFTGHEKTATIPANSTYTFHSDKRCPHSLSGTLKGYTTHKILYYCIKSGKSSDYPVDCGQDPFTDTNCKSSSHEITPFQNNEGMGYHFQKK